MKTLIVYDDQLYNTGTIYIGRTKYEYSYDTDIKELVANIFDELNIDFEEKAFDYEEEE